VGRHVLADGLAERAVTPQVLLHDRHEVELGLLPLLGVDLDQRGVVEGLDHVVGDRARS
jgi:hypothetical protein